MRIVPFEEKHIPAAQRLALADYERERLSVPALPPVSQLLPLEAYAANGLGVAAFEGKQMVGFLCCCPPFDHAFRATEARGVFAPMGAHGAIPENRERIYAAMYQAAAEKWVKAGAVSHALCLYAHDEVLQRQFFQYGFGLRCVDGIRPMTAIPVNPCLGYELVQLRPEEVEQVFPLELALYRHYCQSPFFMRRTPPTREAFLATAHEDEAVWFAAKHQGLVCAYVKVSATGETCVAAGNGYRHVNGAYCLPEHRGQGLYPNLLNTSIEAMGQLGYTRLGVDFESFNPTAWGFWRKHFASYTHSVVRRVDENIVRG